MPPRPPNASASPCVRSLTVPLPSPGRRSRRRQESHDEHRRSHDREAAAWIADRRHSGDHGQRAAGGAAAPCRGRALGALRPDDRRDRNGERRHRARRDGRRRSERATYRRAAPVEATRPRRLRRHRAVVQDPQSDGRAVRQPDADPRRSGVRLPGCRRQDARCSRLRPYGRQAARHHSLRQLPVLQVSRSDQRRGRGADDRPARRARHVGT